MKMEEGGWWGGRVTLKYDQQYCYLQYSDLLDKLFFVLGVGVNHRMISNCNQKDAVQLGALMPGNIA
jgi:hypothetical protein